MDYVILSAVMAVVFGLISLNREHKGFCLISSFLVFIFCLAINIAWLPIINLTSFRDIWLEFMVTAFTAALCYSLLGESDKFSSKAVRTLPFFISILILLVMEGRSFRFYQADRFCQMLKVDTVALDEFNQDIFPTSVRKMICVDASMARKAAEDLLDTDPGLGSRVYVGEMTMQPIDGSFTIDGGKRLTFEDGVIWVAPLEHKSFRKWWINDVTPGYVIVDATDANMTRRYIVREVNGRKLALRYLESGCLWDDIEFHIKINGYTGKGLNDHRFEIDNSGNPFWVLSAYEPQIGVDAKDSQGAITVDAQSGELKEYCITEAPAWIDRIQPEDFVFEQISWWGKYQLGWWNSWWNQLNVQCPTPGLTLVYSQGRSYWYTGIQSSGNSESTSGFMLVDTRDKTARYYKMAGVNEQEAQNIADDIPFARTAGYQSIKPVLYNLRGVPSYFLVYKGGSGNATGYAFVSVANRSVFGAGTTPEEAEREYLNRMSSSGMINYEDDKVEKVEGVYTIRAITRVGETFYLRLKEAPGCEFSAHNNVSHDLKWSEPEDRIHIGYGKGESKYIPISEYKNLDLSY